MAGDTAETDVLKRTALHALHLEHGAKMVPFAGWDMPVQFAGVMGEHLHTREAAGLFDVSHMGQLLIEGDNAATALEALVPQAISSLKPGRQKYAFFPNEAGGLIDDLMITNLGDHLYLVVNAARVDEDLAHLRANLENVRIVQVKDRALVALQGPAAAAELARIVPDVADMAFMTHRVVESEFGALWVSRSGYTGEDGFEISVENVAVAAFARALLQSDAVAPIGLAARDSLRLEAGLCLYGSDIDETTSPVEAGLAWAIQKVRRQGGARAGGFPGDARILRELEEGTARFRVGLRPEGRAPMRAGVALYPDDASDTTIGAVTSGGFGPSVGAPIAMGYVPADMAKPGTRLFGEVRGKRLPVIVSALPFHPHSYKR